MTSVTDLKTMEWLFSPRQIHTISKFGGVLECSLTIFRRNKEQPGGGSAHL